MDAAAAQGLDRATWRHLYRRALLRPLLTVTALVLLYYALPMDRPRGLPLIVPLRVEGTRIRICCSRHGHRGGSPCAWPA